MFTDFHHCIYKQEGNRLFHFQYMLTYGSKWVKTDACAYAQNTDMEVLRVNLGYFKMCQTNSSEKFIIQLKLRHDMKEAETKINISYFQSLYYLIFKAIMFWNILKIW